MYSQAVGLYGAGEKNRAKSSTPPLCSSVSKSYHGMLHHKILLAMGFVSCGLITRRSRALSLAGIRDAGELGRSRQHKAPCRTSVAWPIQKENSKVRTTALADRAKGLGHTLGL